jgi:hypothetical protein
MSTLPAGLREAQADRGELYGAVRTATLVDPRVTRPASLKRTNTRLLAGSKGTVPVPATKIPKVGVALALI